MDAITRGGYCEGHGPMRKLGLATFDVHPNPQSEETHTHTVNVWMCSSCGSTVLIATHTDVPERSAPPILKTAEPLVAPKPAPHPTTPLARIAELIITATGVAWHRESLTDDDEVALKVFAEKLASYAAPEKNRPQRFRARNESTGTAHPADHPVQHGCYFPRTDLCVWDMGARGTGRPKNVEWIDEEGMHLPSSYSFDVAFIVQEMHFLKSDITPAHLALMIDKAAEHADGCPHGTGRADADSLKAFAARLRQATIKTPSG